MGLGGKYFLPCSRTMGDLLVMMTAIFIIVGIAMIILAYLGMKASGL